MNWWEMYTYPFIQNALLVGMFGGGLLAFLGVLVHLRRVVFVGAALPQLLVFGVAAAWFLGGWPVLGAVLAGGAGIGLLVGLSSFGRLGPEGWIGLVFAGGGSLAVVLIALSPAPDARVLSLFTGDILGTSRTEAVVAVVAALMVALVFRIFWSRMVLTSFDRATAAAAGVRVRCWDALLFGSILLGIVVVMHSAGIMLAFSMLVGPPAGALLLFRSLPLVVMAAAVGGAVTAWLGLSISFVADLPGGPTMASAALLPVAVAAVVHGVRRFRWPG